MIWDTAQAERVASLWRPGGEKRGSYKTELIADLARYKSFWISEPWPNLCVTNSYRTACAKLDRTEDSPIQILNPSVEDICPPSFPKRFDSRPGTIQERVVEFPNLIL